MPELILRPYGIVLDGMLELGLELVIEEILQDKITLDFDGSAFDVTQHV